jgi:hypothetical protein
MEKDEERKEVEWIAFSVHAYGDCHRVNEEREAKFAIGFEKGEKKPRTRVTLSGGKRKRLSFRSLTGHSL